MSPRMSSKRLSLILPLVLVIAAIVLRYVKVDALANFSPFMALAFAGTLVFSRKVPFWALTLVMIGVDMAANGPRSVLHVEAVAVYGCFALAAWFAGRARGHISLLGGLVGVVACTLVFYAVTNTVSWLSDANYAKTFAGWTQAMTSGVPGLPPTVLFLYKSLLSDVGFACALFAAFNLEASVRKEKLFPVFAAA